MINHVPNSSTFYKQFDSIVIFYFERNRKTSNIYFTTPPFDLYGFDYWTNRNNFKKSFLPSMVSSLSPAFIQGYKNWLSNIFILFRLVSVSYYNCNKVSSKCCCQVGVSKDDNSQTFSTHCPLIHQCCIVWLTFD